ncbi:MAG: diaminopimelate epimerase [Dehalococcoidales bacterium]|jgi:diaminopimelate epimerase
MKFTKMQGAGNDFVVVDAKNKRLNWNELAIKMCDRHYGIGADGLLVKLPSKKADFKMRIFNADGSESAVCGNGLRCLVSHYLDSDGNGLQDQITVETSIDIRTAKIQRGPDNATEIKVNMGAPKIGIKTIPVAELQQKSSLDIMSLMNRVINIDRKELLLNLVSVGNPHAVHFIDEDVMNFPLAEVGPEVERHKLFPDETNFEVVKIINRNKIEARVWERGVGETLACGSGACAIMAAGQLTGKLDNKVEMKLPGGILKVEWDYRKDNNIYLSGPTETVFSGEW